jgi:hypothetical protein
MLGMRKRTTISLEDIRRISIICANCKSETLIDMGPKLEFSAVGRKQFAPSHCNVCLQAYDSVLLKLNKLQPIYQDLVAANIPGLCFVTDSDL